MSLLTYLNRVFPHSFGVLTFSETLYNFRASLKGQGGKEVGRI
jgi:hypothetical protein